MKAQIDWKLTADANEGTKHTHLDIKRGLYSVVIRDQHGAARAPCAAHDAPEILRVLNGDAEEDHGEVGTPLGAPCCPCLTAREIPCPTCEAKPGEPCVWRAHPSDSPHCHAARRAALEISWGKE